MAEHARIDMTRYASDASYIHYGVYKAKYNL